MRLSQFQDNLRRQPHGKLRFILPDGSPVPAHFHVTEVARVTKRFVDCGGTLRNEVTCRLQVWVADDLEHRLTPGKLDGVLQKAAGPVLEHEDLLVEIEYEAPVISQFAVVTVEEIGNTFLIRTAHKHTDCLAKELCIPGSGKCC
jgi:Family of unknown function (DUF6428)